ncbi:MAG: hypothetical protein PWQ59_834, partial [Thermoanaerobacterium sp.]|nr:hypothetical protein [Thermoanaerobacterium sp.]
LDIVFLTEFWGIYYHEAYFCTFVNCEFFILFESLGKSSIIIIKKIYQ